jgi:hypothetical protein
MQNGCQHAVQDCLYDGQQLNPAVTGVSILRGWYSVTLSNDWRQVQEYVIGFFIFSTQTEE